MMAGQEERFMAWVKSRLEVSSDRNRLVDEF